jgi:rhodanese-related sulfurtransferase
MKELEKTKRISIGAVLFILVVIIALLTYERPKHYYKVNTEVTLSKLLTEDYFVTLNEVKNEDFVLIDVRNSYDYDNGHIENAINIHTPELLSDNSTNIFEEIKNNNDFAVLYGNNPTEANSAFMILYQLGYDNVKILLVNNKYSQNKLITESPTIGSSVADINAFIKESQKNANVIPSPEKKIKKKVITVKKKKKKVAEGGC